MRLISKIDEMAQHSRLSRTRASRVGLVPTMGALHEGHLSLVRAARAKCDVVAVSIFVNPTQFGPNEDFAQYPRDLDRDCALLKKEGVDLVFAPSAQEMYLKGAVTWVTVEGMSDRLCGRTRPGHFRGVTTVVSKLFHIIEPDSAFFGQKDAAQVAIIKRMVSDLNLPIQIEVCPIVRAADGLALSSRNAYLSAAQRKSALILHRSLLDVKRGFEAGERDVDSLIAAGKNVLASEAAARLDYFEIVDPETLERVTTITRPSLAAVAAFVGRTRLIDNLSLEP